MKIKRKDLHSDQLLQNISYFHQISITLSTNPSNIFEIGVGDKYLYNYMMSKNVKITTGDIDSNKKPDILMTINNIPLKDASVDTIVAFEVLEHLPWSDFAKCLQELKRISRKYVILSLPYQSLEFELVLKIPYLIKFCRTPIFDFYLRIPSFFSKVKNNSEHYWEIGRRGYPISKIRKEILYHYEITQEIRPILHGYHYFFILIPKKV